MTNQQSTGQFQREPATFALIQLSLSYFGAIRNSLEESVLVSVSKKYEGLATKKDAEGKRLSSKQLYQMQKSFKAEIRAAKSLLDRYEKITEELLKSINVDEQTSEHIKESVYKIHNFITNESK